MFGNLKLGPDGYNKIALLGTAQASMALAPFKDPSWAIWSCSPGTYSICAQNRSDVWFEPHRWLPTEPGKAFAPGTKPWFSPEFHAFLKTHRGPVFMSEVESSIPSSVRIPFEALQAKHGPYHWTSTIAYMIAMAIEALVPRAQAGEKVAIGLWGIDMSATEEWAYQRPACQHFIGLAMSFGIHILLPQESDLMRPPTMYGLGELNPRHIRMMARRAEVQANIAQCEGQAAELQKKAIMYRGILSEIDYVLGSWTDDVQFDPRQAVSFAGQYARPVGELQNATGAEVVPITSEPKTERA